MKKIRQHENYWPLMKKHRRMLGHPEVGLIEQRLLEFVFDRTIGWSRDEAEIPIRHFVEGVWSREKDGEPILVHAPIPAHKDTIYKKLKKLTELGLIKVTEPDEPTDPRTYELNFEGEYEMPKIKPPKRLQKFAKNEPEIESESIENTPHSQIEGLAVTDLRPRGHRPETQTIREGEKEKEKMEGEERPTRERVSSSSGELEEARMRNEERKKNRAKKQESLESMKHLTHANLSRFWLQAVGDRFPDPALRLADKERCALYAKQKAFKAAHRSETFPQMLCWCLDNWGAIIKLHFGWMKSKPHPTKPEPWFLVTHFTKFDALFSRRANWVRSTDGYDPNDELSQRLAAGQSYEEAMLAMRDAKRRRQDEKRIERKTNDLATLVREIEKKTPQELAEDRNKARAAWKEVLNSSVEDWD